jgi:hypothetical protein
MSDNKNLQTPYGVFGGVISSEKYPSGEMKSIRLADRNVILTHAGELTPAYGEETARRKFKASVSFHRNGTIKAVSLEQQQDVQTPIGELPAELITFYDTGELKRVFPLDGKISGYWTEEDERGLNVPLNFEFEFSSFTAMLTGVCFYKSGDIKSITLFPGEEVTVKAPIGAVSVRQGFSLFESGRLKSLEPAEGVIIETPIGTIKAYDPGANGVNADSNSLCFDEKGRVIGLATSLNGFLVQTLSGEMRMFRPAEALNPLDGESVMIVPLKVGFDYEKNIVTIECADAETAEYSFNQRFTVFDSEMGCSGSDCGSCRLCGH